MGFAAMTVLVAGVTLAQAQINPFGRWAQPGLTEEDSKLLHAAAEKVYANPKVKVGDKQAWNNPKSGSKGTVEATRLFKSHDMPCTELLYTFFIKEAADPGANTLVLSHCHAPDGSWKIL
jgi:surface antigen